MEKYYGNYLGLVINNQDPEGRDRVQIYVPGVTNTLYDNWNNNDTNKSIGMDIGSTFTLNEQILKKLKSVLPWAEKATPLIGPGCSVYQQSGGGSDSSPFGGSQSSASTPTSSNVNTSKGDRPDIDGYSTNGLSDKMYEITREFKEAFPNSKVNSTERYVKTRSDGSEYVVGKDLRTEIKNSSPNSLHVVKTDQAGNVIQAGNAIDIDMPTDVKEQEKMVLFMAERGITEFGWEGNHLHFGLDKKKKVHFFDTGGNVPSFFYNMEKDLKSGKITTDDDIPAPVIIATSPVAAHPPSAEQTIGPVVTTKPATGIKSAYPDTPSSKVAPGPGTPEGNRSTTRPLCRVWLFFYGGDVQKPVFFAYSLPPNETYAHNSVSAPNQSGSDPAIINEVPEIDFVSDNPEITRSTKSSDGSEIINGKIFEVPLPEQSPSASPVEFEIDIPYPFQYTQGKKTVTGRVPIAPYTFQ